MSPHILSPGDLVALRSGLWPCLVVKRLGRIGRAYEVLLPNRSLVRVPSFLLDRAECERMVGQSGAPRSGQDLG